jgi:hypothetical protein
MDTDSEPTAKQLRYLRDLAQRRRESFAYPQTAAEASREIGRLRERPSPHRTEARLDRLAVSRAIAECGDDASVSDREIAGYGSSARWR